ncbi:hypothetical protein [Sporosarcina sp. JAI121]|uniref:hypothetical protein n=1 Tax=Sporosarcina sp. JAI121 TaxID=2723064 RepID=UPI0015C950F9|nr:hypothetical protein [Sporosarcina sp. JAI121]
METWRVSLETLLFVGHLRGFVGHLAGFVGHLRGLFGDFTEFVGHLDELRWTLTLHWVTVTKSNQTLFR